MATKVLSINAQQPEHDKIREAAQVIRSGGLVIFPTETVYGIAADYSNPEAMARLNEVKKRSEGKPFSVMISQRSVISNYTSYTGTQLYKLIDRYWPGPLTVVVPGIEHGTVGIRVPNHQVALQMVEASQRSIAAPSANIEGNPPPTTCEEALKDLDGLVDLALDSGPVDLGVSSTVVDFTQEKPTILREGMITQGDIDHAANQKHVLFVCTGNSCRSVMAEYLLKDRLRNRDDVIVSSCGVGVMFPSHASAETISVLREKDIDATHHKSQPATPLLLKKADLIFTMTRDHRRQLLEAIPSVEKRTFLLREFIKTTPGTQHMMDIPDPIGGSHQEYQHCLNTISEAIEKIMELV